MAISEARSRRKLLLKSFTILSVIRCVDINKKLIFIPAILISILVFLSTVKAEDKLGLDNIRESYGSSPGSDKWNPNADLNRDGIVNVIDLALASRGDSTNSEGYNPLQDGTTVISVDPDNTFVDLVGKNFSVGIDVTDAISTYGLEFKLSWNASLLNLTNFSNGTFLAQRGDVYCAQDLHYDEGWLMFGCILLEPTVPQSYNSGNLAILNFTTLGKGETALHLYDTYLLDDNLNSYAHETEDGNATIGIIEIISPENIIYYTKIVDLNYTTKIVPSWTSYSLDNQPNVTLTGNTHLYCLANGNHDIILYATDSSGNTYSSDRTYFIIDFLNGDVNGDCIVDVLDLSQFGKAYGSVPGSPDWDPFADLNCNNVVDIFDLFYIGRNYGSTKSCPPGGLASPITALHVEPEKTSASDAINETFNVNISVDPVENLYAFGFRLTYDPNILTATNVADVYLNKPTWLGKRIIDNNKGEVQFEITSWIGAKPKTGKGTLATVTFQVKDFGKTNLILSGTKLANYNIKLIGHNVTDGLFVNYIPAAVRIDPSTLNLKDRGKFTSYINLPAPYSVGSINVNSVKLWYQNNYIQASFGAIQNDTLMVKFDRNALQGFPIPTGNVELAIIGEVYYNNRYVDFKGLNTVKIIDK